jgi:hypothetical protein
LGTTLFGDGEVNDVGAKEVVNCGGVVDSVEVPGTGLELETEAMVCGDGISQARR